MLLLWQQQQQQQQVGPCLQQRCVLFLPEVSLHCDWTYFDMILITTAQPFKIFWPCSTDHRQKQHLTLFGKRQTAEDGLQARRTYQFQVSHVVEFALGLQTLATSPDLVGKGSRKYVCQGFLKVGCMAKNLASASWQQRTRWALASVDLMWLRSFKKWRERQTGLDELPL